MANTLPKNLEQQVDMVIKERQAALKEPRESPSPLPKTTITTPPVVSSHQLQTARQSAVAEKISGHQLEDRSIVSIFDNHLRLHQLGDQYLLSIWPVYWALLIVLGTALVAGAATWLVARVLEGVTSPKQIPRARVKRLEL